MDSGLQPPTVQPQSGSRTFSHQTADSAQLVRTHTAFVSRIARSVFHRMSSSTPLEDLIQIGNIALIEASRDFVDRGTARFTTYAGIRIRGAMVDELRRSATVSRLGLQNRRRLAAVRDKLSGTTGRPPTDLEMAQSQAMSLPAYRAMQATTQGFTYESIDAGYSDFDSAYADTGLDALEQLEQQQFGTAMTDAIARLPRRQATVLQLYFIDELDLAAIGRLMGVGPARVCQIKKEALETLRHHLKIWVQ